MGEVSTYKAFISYSHADKRQAVALHRWLEGFRGPVGGDGRPTSLKPIFRDRDELSAGGDLSASLRTALDRSDHLIVLCSKASRRSRWVAAEIAHFVARAGLNRLLCVLLDEPAAKATVLDCLPSALAQAYAGRGEPLVADLRPGGDGRGRARLKLAAGLMGVGLDALVQREARRRLAWMTGVAATATVVSLCMAGLMVMALDARRLAQARNAQAEDLVAYMLGDLREKLEPVGRLDLLDGVGRKVLDHYERAGVRGLDDAAMIQRARALTQVGSIRAERGDLAGARIAFVRASDTAEGLVVREPRDPGRLFEAAQATYWLAYVDWREGRAVSAERGFARYAAQADALIALEPSNPDWRLERAYAQSNLGTVRLAQGRLEPALTAFRVAQDEFARASARAPRDSDRAADLADARNWVADVLLRLGRLEAAYEERLQAAAALELRRRTDPANMPLVAQVHAAEVALARRAIDLGRLDEARRSVERARAGLQGLVTRDPDNATWRRHLAIADLELVDLAIEAGDWPLAVRQHAAAVAELDRLKRQEGTAYGWRADLAGRAQRQAIALAELAGNRAGAKRLARELIADLAAVSGGADEEERAQLMTFALLRLDDPKGAVGWLALREATLTPSGRDLLVRARLADGQVDSATKLSLALRESGYSRPSFLAFCANSRLGVAHKTRRGDHG